MTTQDPASIPAPDARPRRTSSRIIAIAAMALGGVVVLGTLQSTVATTVASASVRTAALTVDTTGVDEIDIDLSAGVLRLEFADVDEARLSVTSSGAGVDRWTFERDDSALTVSSPDVDFGWASPWTRGASEAVLTLPRSLEGADASLQVSAGQLEAAGTFDELDLDMGAGSAMVTGTARDVSADLSAGEVELDLADVRESDLTVDAGWMQAAFTGTAPRAVTADVSAGALELEVPAGEYLITSDVSTGGFDDQIGSTPGAASTIGVQVSAGAVTLTAGR